MSEQAGGARFGLEPRQQFCAVEPGAFFAEADGFHGDGAADDRVDGLVDNAHGAAAELANDLVPSGFAYCFHL